MGGATASTPCRSSSNIAFANEPATLIGSGGDDTLLGLNASDALNGGDGIDLLLGDLGDSYRLRIPVADAAFML